MQITLENLWDLERKLHIVIPAEDIENKVKVKLREVAAKAKIPGFRPGKVPADIIIKNYASSVRADVLEKLLQETYMAALEQKQLNPAGLPQIKIISSKPQEQFEYEAIFEVYPEIKINDLQQTEVEKSVATVVAADVDEMLERMRKSHAVWQEITDPAHKAQVGEQITVDFTVKPCDTDKAVEAKTEKGVKFILGDGSMWADFEQPLHGVSGGEEKQFILQMPSTHTDQHLAGRRVEFAVKVHKICAPILPALDDEFAAKMHIKEGGIAKLKEEVRTHMERELEVALNRIFKQAIMNKLLEYNPIALPKSLVEQDLKMHEENWQRRFAAAHEDKANAPAFPRSDFIEQAKRNVALGLLMSTIIREHHIVVKPEEVLTKMQDLVSAYYEDQETMMHKLGSDQKYLSEIESLLLEEKLLAYLATQVKVSEKNISYQEAIAKK